MVFDKRSWGTLLFKECARTNQRVHRPSDFLIFCGVSSNAAGMVTLHCDQRSGRLCCTLGKQQTTGTGSCHLGPRPRISCLTPGMRCQCLCSNVSFVFRSSLDIAHRATIQVKLLNHHRTFSRRVPPNRKLHLSCSAARSQCLLSGLNHH